MNQEQFDELTEQSKNTISAKVICDSVAPNGCRLTTMEWTYPRMIHSEIMTHRKLSRNAASSRAIPLSKMIQRVQSNPVFPIHWGKNQKGMQADEELSPINKLIAGQDWMYARDNAIEKAEALEELGVHKQIGNRLLEPWMWITVIVSATNLENLFALRCHPAAEPHFQNLAYKIRNAYDKSKPDTLEWGEYHLPLFGAMGGSYPEDFDIPNKDNTWMKVSAARCARVSYLTQDGKRDPLEDIKLYERLASSFPLHASPLEHPAQAIKTDYNQDERANMTDEELAALRPIDWGNFDPGWLQFRKMHENENVTKRV
jgi:hypothetical protein